MDRTGIKYDRLTALRFSHKDQYSRAHWVCRCECENLITVMGGHLSTGHTTSCGCKNLKHGHGDPTDPTYCTWVRMRQRCEQPKLKAYPRYGGRGIIVCERWQKYENFLADMGPRPDGLSLDRINNDGNYEPGNCRWATDYEQQNNRSSNRPITWRGRTQNLKQWAKELGMRHTTLSRRLGAGWSTERAFTEPLQEQFSHRKNK